MGRGKELRFFATDEEILEVLTAGLPHEYRPYKLLGHWLQQAEGKYRHAIFACPIEGAIGCLKRCSGSFANIRPHADDDDLEVDPEKAVELWSMAGLPILEHGYAPRGRQEASRIAIVDRVRNVTTGSVMASPYLNVFNALRHQIERRLEWSTIRTLADGSNDEDDLAQLMTRAAADAARRDPGRWIVQPGHRL